MGRIRHQSGPLSPNGPAETRFNNLINQYDKYIAKNMAETAAWRLAFFIMLALVGISIFGWYRTINMPRTVPLVIEVNENGDPEYRGRVDQLSYQTFQPQAYMIKAHLTRYVKNLYEINLDGTVMANNINDLSYWSSEQVREMLRRDVAERQPFSKIGLRKVEVIIETIINITGNTWQVDWVEIEKDMYGREMERVRKRGLYTIVIQTPASEEALEKNPLGIYIVDFNVETIRPIRAAGE